MDELQLCSILVCIASLSEGAFTSEPSNITVVEGESVTFNCSMAATSEDIATWVIDGVEYYWSDFGSIQIYTFNLRDNSLTVQYSPTSLDGSSFQCILDNRRSGIGYLRVLHLPPTSLTTQNSSNPSTSTDEAKSVHLDLTLPSLSTVTLPLTTSTPETTSSTFHVSVILVASISGTIIAFSLLSVCCVLVLCLLQRSSASKSDIPSGSLSAPGGGFSMEKNELYVLTQPIKIEQNPVYAHIQLLSKPP